MSISPYVHFGQRICSVRALVNRWTRDYRIDSTDHPTDISLMSYVWSGFGDAHVRSPWNLSMDACPRENSDVFGSNKAFGKRTGPCACTSTLSAARMIGLGTSKSSNTKQSTC